MVVDTQLVIGPYEAEVLGEKEILRRFTTYIERVPTRRLLFWNTQSERYFDLVLNICEQEGIEPYLWYPVLADRKAGQLLPGRYFSRSGAGYDGWGTGGRWEGLTGGDERFLFSCPTHGIDPRQEGEQIVSLLERFSFAGVFLDRIRYPSPANGLEQLFSCFCPACLIAEERAELLPLAKRAYSLLGELCAAGEALSWMEFLERAGIEDLQRQKEEAIEDLVHEIGGSIDRSRYLIGLDLFSPSLAPLVGQSYERLSMHCDWIKAMTYAKAEGPATLVLECKALIDGVQSVASHLPWEEVATWVAQLLGFSQEALLPLEGGGSLVETLLGDEVQRAENLAVESEVVCGIELVDHPLFVSQISTASAQRMLEITRMHTDSVISCWNLLYIPEETLPLLLF